MTTETKVKHTPGPWEYGKAQNYDGFYIAPKGTLPTLASVERIGTNLKINCFNFPGDTEANARLIAAAPEFLEALKEMVEVARFPCTHEARTGRTASDVCERAEIAIRKVDAATAKAERRA